MHELQRMHEKEIKMGKKIKILWGFPAILAGFSLSVHLILAGGSFNVPLKLYVLFASLGIAIFGYYKKISWLRNITLLFSLAYLGFFEAGCLCSNGSLETIFMYIGSEKLARIGKGLLRISVLLGVTYYLGNLFCGWVCPKGAVQEFLYKKKYLKKIPEKLDFILRKFRYILLLLIIIYPLIYHQRIYNKIDPFKMVFNFTGALYILIFMAVILITSIFVYRPFCRYFCPLGALLGLINKIGIFKPRLADRDNCICKNKALCEIKCPAQAIKKAEYPVVDNEFCFSCLECEEACIGKK